MCWGAGCAIVQYQEARQPLETRRNVGGHSRRRKDADPDLTQRMH